jgi:hypothetical protein
MRWLVHTRVVLARKPWLVWIGVGLVSLVAGLGVDHQVRGARAAERAWGTSRWALVATRDVAAGTPADAAGLERRRLPAVAVPATALDHVEDGAVVVRSVPAGAVVVPADVGRADARFALVPAGDVLVAVPRPDVLAPVQPGDHVEVSYVDRAGALTTVAALAVSVTDDAVVVAAARQDGARLAAAATDPSTPVGVLILSEAEG